MSGVKPGDYYIVNSQISSTGSHLAITYVDRGSPLIVTAKSMFVTQKWTVCGDPGANQTITPVYDKNLQAAPEGNYIAALPARDCFWYITSSGDGYQVTNEPVTHAWGINEVREGEKVMIEKPNGDKKQVWNFILA